MKNALIKKAIENYLREKFKKEIEILEFGFIGDALIFKESLKNNYERLGRIHGDFWDKNILYKYLH